MSTELGTEAVFKIGDSTNTLQDVSAYLKESGLTREIDALDATTFGKRDKVYKAGLKDSSISLGGEWEPTIDGILDGILGLDGQAYEYYPQGVGSGLPKYAGTFLLTKYETKDKVDELGEFSADLQGSDTVTRTIQP